MHILEVSLFVAAVVGVVWLGIWKSKGTAQADQSASGYFLAGRGLTWWLVGFSLIAANISTEQFIGMSGASADWLGLSCSWRHRQLFFPVRSSSRNTTTTFRC
jgi:SSS family solute:Na+ symporter